MARQAMSREAAIALFWSRFDRSGGVNACHPWTGPAEKNGYGQFNAIVLGGKKRVHVLAYELYHGPLEPDPATGRKPDVDHECHNSDLSCPGGKCAHRLCGNILHLVAKGNAENRAAADEGRERGAFKSLCDYGHVLDQANTGIRMRKSTRNGKLRAPERYCRICTRTMQCTKINCKLPTHDHQGTPWQPPILY